MAAVIPGAQPPSAVTVSLKELQDGSVSLETLEEAFGPASLGIIIVRDLPSNFVSLRRTLLSYSSYLGNLPETELGMVSRGFAIDGTVTDNAQRRSRSRKQSTILAGHAARRHSRMADMTR
jgi:hypothetical protein